MWKHISAKIAYICSLRSCACIHCWSTPMWPSCTTTKLFTIFVAGTWILSVLPTPIWTDWLPRLSVHWRLLSVPRKSQKALGRPCTNLELVNEQWCCSKFNILSNSLNWVTWAAVGSVFFSMVQHAFQQRSLSTLSALIGWNASGFDGALNVDITELLKVKLTIFCFDFLA